MYLHLMCNKTPHYIAENRNPTIFLLVFVFSWTRRGGEMMAEIRPQKLTDNSIWEGGVKGLRISGRRG